MGGVMAKVVFKSGNDEISAKYNSLLEIPVTTIEGQKKTFAEVAGNKFLYLVVNVASK